MKALPPDAQPYRRTPEFTEETMPSGLKSSHSTKSGVWGRIVVLEGSLVYRILQSPVQELRLDSDHPGVVEPEVKHEVQPLGKVRFYVQFYR